MEDTYNFGKEMKNMNLLKETNFEQIKGIIESNEFHNFQNQIHEQLGIIHREYRFKLEPFKRDKDGFRTQTLAHVYFPEYKDVAEITFYTETIQDMIKGLFCRIPSTEAFDEIVSIFLKLALVHEIIHILQFEEQRITKESMRHENSFMYGEGPLEADVSTRIKGIFRQMGGFSEEVMKVINSGKSLDNDSAEKLNDLYQK